MFKNTMKTLKVISGSAYTS